MTLPTTRVARRSGRRAALVLGVVALTLTGLTQSASAQPTPSPAAAVPLPTSGIAWTDCTEPFLAQFGAVCGTVPVPLDHSRPAGPIIQLAVSMVRHTTPDSEYQGAALVNAGGQGFPALWLSSTGAFVPNQGGAAYDWIGFDPRGIGSSTPKLSCDPNWFGPDRSEYVPYKAGVEAAWRARSRAYAAACAARNGPLLAHMTTADNARDMESIRIALGLRQITYYGLSYGTYLGEVYSSLFPGRVRRLILDSAVDPTLLWPKSVLATAPAWDRNLLAWFGWIARNDATYGLGSTAAQVEHRYLAEQNALRAEPAGGQVGPDEWTDIFTPSATYQHIWPQQAAVFADWVRTRDAAALVAAYTNADGPGDDNVFAATTATRCTDTAWPRDFSTVRAASWATFVRAPLTTWQRVWNAAPCLYWPVPASTPVRIDGSRVDSALLVHETQDAAIPYSGSLQVRARYPGASLIAVAGGTSDGSTLFGNTCTDYAIAAYLATGALPERKAGSGADVTCAPLPEPVPDTGTAAPAAQ